MSTTPARRDGSIASSLPGQLTPTSYQLPTNLGFTEWERAVAVIVSMGQSVMWWLGDAIRYGETQYGEMYAQAIDATALDVDTLRHVVWTCEHVPEWARRPKLPFWHHREVATLEPDDQVELLAKAEHEHWTRQTLREAAQRQRNGSTKKVEVVDDRSGDTKAGRKVACPKCGHRFDPDE